MDSLNDVASNEVYREFVANTSTFGLVETFRNYVQYDAPFVKSHLSSTYFMIDPIIYEGLYGQTGLIPYTVLTLLYDKTISL